MADYDDPIPVREGQNVWDALRNDSLAKRFTPPLCAVCGKIVDSFKALRDDPNKAVIFVVSCHGEAEVVKLRWEDIEEMKWFSFSCAFQKNALEEP